MNKETVKVEFTKNSKGEIIGVKVNEYITESQLLKYFVYPEIKRALKAQKQTIKKEMFEEFLGSIAKEKATSFGLGYKEAEETIKKKIAGMKCNLCQCDNPEEEMNRCKKCRLVIENKLTANQTIEDIINII